MDVGFREPSKVPRLMLVTDRHAVGSRDLVQIVGAAVAGGVDAVQVREKDLADGELTALTGLVQRAVRARAAVLVNGRPEVAKSLGAGLHLPEDARVPVERDWPIWGRSVHSPEEALRLAEEGARLPAGRAGISHRLQARASWRRPQPGRGDGAGGGSPSSAGHRWHRGRQRQRRNRRRGCRGRGPRGHPEGLRPGADGAVDPRGYCRSSASGVLRRLGVG